MLEKIRHLSFCLKCNNTVTLPEENGTGLPALSVMYISIVENTCFVRGVYTGEEYCLNAITPKTPRRRTTLMSGPLESSTSLVCMTSIPLFRFMGYFPYFREPRQYYVGCVSPRSDVNDSDFFFNYDGMLNTTSCEVVSNSLNNNNNNCLKSNIQCT